MTATDASAPARPVATRTGRGRPGGRTAMPFLLIAPAVVLLVLFMLIPICYSIWLSLRSSKVTGGALLGVRKEHFAGFANYVTSLTDSTFWAALGRMAGYGVIVVCVMFILAIVFALMLDHPNTHGRPVWRALIFIPYAVPGVIASLMWGFIYLPGVSPIHEALSAVGLPTPDFLGPNTVIFSTANIAIWGGTGFNMIVLYTALRSIPTEIYEAARVDGASELRIAMRIKLPLIGPALVMTMIFALIAMIQVYNEPTALSTITHSVTSDWMPMMKVYNDAFVVNDQYLAAAESVLLALLTFGVSAIVMRVSRRFQGFDS